MAFKQLFRVLYVFILMSGFCWNSDNIQNLTKEKSLDNKLCSRKEELNNIMTLGSFGNVSSQEMYRQGPKNNR